MDFAPMFGGVANYWTNLNHFFPSDNFVVLAPEYDNSLDFDIKQNYLIYRKNLLTKNKWVWPKWLPLLFETIKLVRQEKIEKIIVANVLPVGTVAYIIKKFFRIPYIVSVHGLDIALPQAHTRKNRLMKKILNEAEHIITNSNFTKELLMKLECCGADSVIIVYPCANINFEKPRQNILDTLANGKLKDKKIILTVGRLIERKGQDKVIQSMPMILKECPDAVYVIVGQGKQLKYLKELVSMLNLDEEVLFFCDVMNYELPGFYESADIFIMPSRRLENGDIEGFGIVYLEANYYGKPVIGGKSGGAVEAVEHDVNGLLVDPLSINEISGAIVELLKNPEKANRLGETGRLRVAKKFNWFEQAKKVIDILN